MTDVVESDRDGQAGATIFGGFVWPRPLWRLYCHDHAVSDAGTGRRLRDAHGGAREEAGEDVRRHAERVAGLGVERRVAGVQRATAAWRRWRARHRGGCRLGLRGGLCLVWAARTRAGFVRALAGCASRGGAIPYGGPTLVVSGARADCFGGVGGDRLLGGCARGRFGAFMAESHDADGRGVGRSWRWRGNQHGART